MADDLNKTESFENTKPGVNDSERKILLPAIIFALLAGVLMYFYISTQKESYGKMTPVLVSVADINRGELIKEELIKKVNIPKRFVSPDYIEKVNLESILNKRAAVNIKTGQQMIWSFVESELQEVTTLTDLLDSASNDRAITIALDPVGSVGGFISREDRVDIIGTFTVPDGKNNDIPKLKTKTILQYVEILVVGDAISRDPSFVTLRLSPEEAELLTFAEQVGTLRLLLRGKGDKSISDSIPIISFNNLFSIEKRQTRKRKKTIKIIN